MGLVVCCWLLLLLGLNGKLAWGLGVFFGCLGDAVDGGMVNRMVLVLGEQGKEVIRL